MVFIAHPLNEQLEFQQVQILASAPLSPTIIVLYYV